MNGDGWRGIAHLALVMVVVLVVLGAIAYGVAGLLTLLGVGR